MDPPPVPTERRGVQNPSAPVRGRARKRSGWDELFADNDRLAALVEKINHDNENLLSRTSPNALRKQRVASDHWCSLLRKLEPGLDENRFWDVDIINRRGMMMVPMLFELSKGRGKGENGLIVADTLLEKAMQFANAICHLGRDPQSKLKAGSKFINDGFLQKLIDQTYTIVTANKLQRHLNKKTYFGREEFQLMVEQALDDSLLRGRKVTLQKVTVVGLAFIIGLRPGSLGPSEKLYEEHEKFLKIKDVEVFQVKPISWRVRMIIRHFKGHNSSIAGMERSVTLEPVKNWYNVMFDIAFWVVLHLFVRGAFRDIQTKEDLIQNKSFKMPFKPEFLELPLQVDMTNQHYQMLTTSPANRFLSVTPGGRDYHPSGRPLGARGVTECCYTMALSAGLPAEGIYAYRRNSGNDMAIIAGKEAAEQLLVHTSSGSLHHYSMNTDSLDVVGLYLNEMPEKHSKNIEHQLERHKLERYAMQVAACTFRRTMAEGAPPENTSQKVVLTQAEKDEILLASTAVANTVSLTNPPSPQNNSEHQQLTQELQARWVAFLDCYDQPKRPGGTYFCGRIGINRLLAHKDTSCRVDKVTADKAHQDILDHLDAVQASRKLLLRAGQQQKKIVENKKRKRGFEATTEELKQARESFRKPSKILHTIAPVASSSATRLDDTAPSTTTSHMDDNEEQNDDEYCRNLQLMYNRARIERPEYSIEIPDDMVDWSQPDEIHDPDATTSAAFTRYGLMLSVLEPIFVDERFEAKLQVNNGLYICDLCTKDNPEAEPHNYKSRSHLAKHMVVQHTEWKNLFRNMVTESGSFKCPAPDCNYKGKTQKQAQIHVLQKCHNKEQYHALKATHDMITAEYFKIVPQ